MAKLEMARGDYRAYPIFISADSYQVGQKIMFAAKSQLDNATDDSAAVIKVDLTDANIVDMAYPGPKGGVPGPFVKYNLEIESSQTNNFQMEGKKQKLIGEFQYVAPGVTEPRPTSYPQLDIILHRDGNRRTT